MTEDVELRSSTGARPPPRRHLLGLQSALLLFAVLLTAAPSEAQLPEAAPPTAGEVDAYVQKGMDQLSIPGAAIALFADGKVTHVNGFGRADRSGTPVTAQTPFQLGSVSKSFAALVILQLADEGRLSLDAPVSQYIPDFQTRDKAASDLITVRHLLNHRSGLSTIDGNRDQATTYRGADAMARAAQKLHRAKLIARPGEQFAYSNANYALAAHLIEAVDGRPFEEAVEARIFEKLGMKNSFVQVPKAGANLPATGHTQWLGWTVQRDFTAGRMMAGPGGITASAEDLAIYLAAVFDNDPRIVPAALSEAFAKERRGGYEFGWEYGTFGDQKVIFHGGLNPGFRTQVAYDPITRQGAMILTNMSGSLEGNLASATTSYALGLPPEPWAPGGAEQLRLWGALAITLALLVGTALSFQRLTGSTLEGRRRSLAHVLLALVLPSLCLLGLSYVFVVVVPGLSGVTLPAVYMFYPDLGVMLFVSAAVAIVWAVVRLVLLLRPRK